MRIRVALVCCLLFVITSLAQLIAQRPPAFDVVSVRRYQPDAKPSLITALREQLGLRLESTRAPVDVLAIESVQTPSEN